MSISDMTDWLQFLENTAIEIMKLSKCQHEPYDNLGDPRQVIEIALDKELQRLKALYEHEK